MLGQSESGDTALLLVERRGTTSGLRVGEVLDFLELPRSAWDGRAPAGVDPKLVQGTGSWTGRPLLLLDIDALLAPYLGG